MIEMLVRLWLGIFGGQTQRVIDRDRGVSTRPVDTGATVDGELPTEMIKSAYSVDQFRPTAHCEECDGDAVREADRFHLTGTKVQVCAERVPVYRCQGECGGTWYPLEVTHDLFTQAIQILQEHGDVNVAQALDKKRRALAVAIERPSTMSPVAHQLAGASQPQYAQR